jgi:integrase
MGKRRGNREGTIYQRSDGRWCGQLTVDRRRETVYGATQEEVQKKLLTRRTELRMGSVTTGEDLTVNELGERWMALIRHKLAGTTIRAYRRDLRLLAPHIGLKYVRELTVWDVSTLYDRLERADVPSASRHLVGTRLRQLLEHARVAGLVAANVAKNVPLPRVWRGEIRPLRPHEVLRFLDTARPNRLYALFLTALDTGAREGELLVLERSDWNPAERTLRFVKTLDLIAFQHDQVVKSKESKTRASRRTVRVDEQTAVAIEQHLARQDVSGPLLFPNTTGGYYWPTNIRGFFFKRLLRDAGLPAREIRFHDLRHTCATLLLLAGVDVKTVAARLGHASPITTLKTYAHLLPEGEDKAVKAIGGFLCRKPMQ